MELHLSDEARAACGALGATLHNGSASALPRDKRIENSVLADAAGCSDHINHNHDGSVNEFRPRPDNPDKAIKAAQTIASEPAYQELELNARASFGKHRNFEESLRQKYKNAPPITTASKGEADLATRYSVGGNLVRVTPEERIQGHALRDKNWSSDAAKSAYTSARLRSLDVGDDQQSVVRALNTTAPTADEALAQLNARERSQQAPKGHTR